MRRARMRQLPVKGAGERTLTVNGEALRVAGGTTVAQLVAMLSRGSAGIAVAVNGELVPRSRWDRTPVAERDQVEVLGAAQGG